MTYDDARSYIAQLLDLPKDHYEVDYALEDTFSATRGLDLPAIESYLREHFYASCPDDLTRVARCISEVGMRMARFEQPR